MAALLKYKKTLLAVLVLAVACVLVTTLGTNTSTTYIVSNQVPGPPLPQYAIDALDNGESFELLSLDPTELDKPATDRFRGYRVLGQTTITDDTMRNQLVAALKKGVEARDGYAACFNPRHGIRVVHNGKTVDFVICFECWQLYVHVGDKSDRVFTKSSPQDFFNETLKKANVPLPTK